jgi:hypothetical protein
MYDNGCVDQVSHLDQQTYNTAANLEFNAATGIIGAANALRERAWEPASMWGWANPLVKDATQSIYRKVFTVFGGITLAIVGLYLLWRSRQSEMSAAMTTAGWAILVMVAVTAIAAWPVRAANAADGSLVTGLNVVHAAVGPPPQTSPGNCGNGVSCQDLRSPARRASDTATRNMLYRNWLRGELGSADSPVAQKYGLALYDATALSWQDTTAIDSGHTSRQDIYTRKAEEWMRVAKQIKAEDPDAYRYLQGANGVDTVGAGFIAILSALFFAMFDLIASLLVLIGFLIFRWAVVAAPILGTIGMLHPASSGVRRLVNVVIAAIFNIVIFGAGAAVYLYAVDLIMGTASLPGWLQVVLVWLCGIVGWLLLRPYRRITQLGGKESAAATLARVGSWHRRFARDVGDLRYGPAHADNPLLLRRSNLIILELRPESRTEEPAARREMAPAQPAQAAQRPEGAGRAARAPVPAGSGGSGGGGSALALREGRRGRWVGADIPQPSGGSAVYVPDSVRDEPVYTPPPRRPESAPVRGG